MSDLLEELKEDLQREKYMRIWQKFGNYIIGAAIAALVLTALGVAGKEYLNRKYDNYSDKLFAASNAPKNEAIAKYDELISVGNATYKAIARVRKASILLENNKIEEALAEYKKVAMDSSAPAEFRDIAKLIYIVTSSNMELDTPKKEDIDAKLFLQDSISDKGIFKYSAMEFEAFQDLKNNNYTKAKDTFSTLAGSADAPSDIKSRAEEMLEAIANRYNPGKSNDSEKTNG